jgi:hypothetical protein
LNTRTAPSEGSLEDVPCIRFIHGDVHLWKDVVSEEGRSIALADLAPRLRLGREIWNVQAFHLLRARGYAVELSDSPSSDAINVVHSDDLDSISEPWNHFLVQVRADREPGFFPQFEIVQNRASVWKPNDLFIPHWPQPGLIPRDATRGSTIRSVMYMGNRWNLAPEFQDPAFARALTRLGIELVVRDDRWWDYHDADVVLAVRGGNPAHLAVKPAAKLVNAWLAGCPALLGAEPGYREVLRSPLDFTEVDGPEAVLSALESMKQDPAHYLAMVANGTSRAGEYTVDVILREWETALFGTIREGFHRWELQSLRERRRRYLAARMRRRVWGYQSTQQEHSRARRAINLARRVATLPRAVGLGGSP